MFPFINPASIIQPRFPILFLYLLSLHFLRANDLQRVSKPSLTLVRDPATCPPIFILDLSIEWISTSSVPHDLERSANPPATLSRSRGHPTSPRFDYSLLRLRVSNDRRGSCDRFWNTISWKRCRPSRIAKRPSIFSVTLPGIKRHGRLVRRGTGITGLGADSGDVTRSARLGSARSGEFKHLSLSLSLSLSKRRGRSRLHSVLQFGSIIGSSVSQELLYIPRSKAERCFCEILSNILSCVHSSTTRQVCFWQIVTSIDCLIFRDFLEIWKSKKMLKCREIPNFRITQVISNRGNFIRFWKLWKILWQVLRYYFEKIIRRYVKF